MAVVKATMVTRVVEGGNVFIVDTVDTVIPDALLPAALAAGAVEAKTVSKPAPRAPHKPASTDAKGE